MVGDDNFLNIAAFDLNYETTYKQTLNSRIRQCGNCVSGLKIAQAKRLIENMDESVKNVIINVGSVDIAEGRELIEMITDLLDLLNTCESEGIDPIVTTLPPLPNYLLGNRREVLIGFNHFIRQKVVQQYAVIDLNLCMVTPEGNTDVRAYQTITRHIGGSNKPFVMWNQLGRNRIMSMIIKNLGHALYFTDFLGTHY